MNRPRPPAHLSPSAAQWWTSTVEDYELHEHHLRLLQLACEAWDRAQGARALLDNDGALLTLPFRDRLEAFYAASLSRRQDDGRLC